MTQIISKSKCKQTTVTTTYLFLDFLIHKGDFMPWIHQHPASMLYCSRSGILKCTVKDLDGTRVACHSNCTQAHPVGPSVEDLHKLWCYRDNKTTFCCWITEAIYLGKHTFEEQLTSVKFSVWKPSSPFKILVLVSTCRWTEGSPGQQLSIVLLAMVEDLENFHRLL